MIIKLLQNYEKQMTLPGFFPSLKVHNYSANQKEKSFTGMATKQISPKDLKVFPENSNYHLLVRKKFKKKFFNLEGTERKPNAKM